MDPISWKPTSGSRLPRIARKLGARSYMIRKVEGDSGVEPRPTRFYKRRETMVKQAGRAALAGMVVGVIVLGLGGRVAMRFVALLIHQAPHLGVGATLGILLIGGILGTLSGAAYGVILQRRWPARVTMKGFLFGSVLFSVLVLLQPPAIRTEVAAARAQWWAIIPLFWAVCVGYALVLARQLPADAGFVDVSQQPGR